MLDGFKYSMKPEAELLRRLCRLIEDTLSPHIDSITTPPLTKQIQTSLLISLSKVFTKIKQWTKEYEEDSHFGDAVLPSPIDNGDCSVLLALHSHDHHCLSRIISCLMDVLAFENPFIQHLTGNILVAIYELLATCEGEWEEFINRISLFMTYAIDKYYSAHLEPVAAEAKNLVFLLPVQSIPLKLKNTTSLLIPAALTRVLRNIMKILKQDFDYEVYDVYISSSIKMISRIPWDLLYGVSAVQSEESVVCLTEGSRLHSSNPQQKSEAIFKGNLLQYFCSLNDNDNVMESGAVSKRKQLLDSAVSNLIPDLLSWCLDDKENSNNVHLFNYFRHKILMLLIRSTSQVNSDFDSLSSWLHLIWKYFPCSLLQQVHCPLSDINDCLEDSPFWLYPLDRKQHQVSPNHLQRLSIFLLFRCSFNLLSLKGTTSDPCACPDNTCLIINCNVAPNDCSRKRGLLELHRWLQGQLHDKIFEDSDMYSTRCINFATSFLRLYIHEDDVLFKMLLQLFPVPVYADRCIFEEEAYLTAKTNMLFLVSDIFNPIHIFHLFLAEIHYDHQVLLDYLISKDSGPISAEYLLRCLRIICTSWYVFVEFPRSKETPLDNKRRKIVTDCVEFKGLTSALPANQGGITSLECTKWSRGHVSLSACENSRQLSFEDAKACLLSLKTSVENLSEKDLFPYNPKVLLNRLRKFEELCLIS